MIKCSFCGYEFNQNDSNTGCAGCPMNRTCNKSKCPNCGFEIPKEPAFISFLKRKRGKNND